MDIAAYLPRDVCIQIFSHIPPKMLLRMRLTCKRWEEYIRGTSDPFREIRITGSPFREDTNFYNPLFLKNVLRHPLYRAYLKRIKYDATVVLDELPNTTDMSEDVTVEILSYAGKPIVYALISAFGRRIKRIYMYGESKDIVEMVNKLAESGISKDCILNAIFSSCQIYGGDLPLTNWDTVSVMQLDQLLVIAPPRLRSLTIYWYTYGGNIQSAADVGDYLSPLKELMFLMILSKDEHVKLVRDVLHHCPSLKSLSLCIESCRDDFRRAAHACSASKDLDELHLNLYHKKVGVEYPNHSLTCSATRLYITSLYWGSWNHDAFRWFLGIFVNLKEFHIAIQSDYEADSDFLFMIKTIKADRIYIQRSREVTDVDSLRIKLGKPLADVYIASVDSDYELLQSGIRSLPPQPKSLKRIRLDS